MGGGLLPQVRTGTHEQMSENEGGLFDCMHLGQLIALCWHFQASQPISMCKDTIRGTGKKAGKKEIMDINWAVLEG